MEKIQFEKYQNVLFIKLKLTNGDVENTNFEEINKKINEKAKEWYSKTIVIQSEQKELLKNFKGYRKVGGLKELLNVRYPILPVSEDDVYVQLQDTMLSRYHSAFAVVIDEINEKEKKEPTLEFHVTEKKEKKMRFDIYYEGKEEILVISFDNKKNSVSVYLGISTIITHPKDCIELNLENYNEEMWKKEWKDFFEKKYNKERLKSLFNVPDKYRRKCVNGLFPNKKDGRKVVDFFIEKFGEKVTENILAIAYKKERLWRLYREQVVFSQIDEHLFVFDTEKDEIFHFIFEEKERAIKSFNELVEKKQEEKRNEMEHLIMTKLEK